MNDPYKKKVAVIVALLVAVAVLIIGIALFNAGSRKGKIAIELFLVPKDAKVVIDGKKSGGGTVYLTPGEHVFVVEKGGFSKSEEKYEIEKETTLVFALSPESEEAVRYAQKNQDLYMEAEGIAGENARAQGEEFLNDNSIASVLPYRGILYDIEYRVDQNDDSKIVVQVVADSAENRALAIGKIRNMGYEPTDYLIEFVDLPQNLELE